MGIFFQVWDYPLYCSSRVICTVAHSIILLKEARLTSHPVGLLEKGKQREFHTTGPDSAAKIWGVLGMRKQLYISSVPWVLQAQGARNPLHWGLANKAASYPAHQPRPPGPTPPDHKRPPWTFRRPDWTTSLQHSRLRSSRPNSELISQTSHTTANGRCVTLHFLSHCLH